VDYHLVYTQRAISDLAEIIGYIAEDNPDAASRFGHSLLDYLDLLRSYP
jgi:plasmid stabilization system protein ParE